MSHVQRAIRVLVVDDSAFMRRAIVKMLTGEPDIHVVGEASTGEESVAKQSSLKPDLITMDVEMPGMGGLEAVRALVARRGPPIIMISALTREGADTTLRALELGAVDFIPKPSSAFVDILGVRADLLAKIRFFGAAKAAHLGAIAPRAVVAPPAGAPQPAAPLRTGARQPLPRKGTYACVAIGTSTGGPVALAAVLPKLPNDFPLPILVVQHMPPGFTKALADRLNAASQISVVEGEDGMLLERGKAIIAPAGLQLTLRRTGSATEVRLERDTKKSLHVPSVDVMAAAVGETFGAAAVGVILTGMGHDGVAGLTVIKQNGGYVIGQDEASAVVYGMPRAAAAAGLVDRVVSLGDVARVLCDVVGANFAVR